MKYCTLFCISFAIAVAIAGCKDDSTEPAVMSKCDVVINDIPFKTEQYLRIPYTIRLWEYEKDGMKLQKIDVLNDETRAVLLSLDKDHIPLIYMNPLKSKDSSFHWDTITSYYTSIQLPILLTQTPPSRISHRFTLRDTVQNKDVVIEGAVFAPRLSEVPIVISSPIKGENLIFLNQSTNAYHFYGIFFLNGNLWRGERFAFDYVRINLANMEFYSGDKDVNESYYCYRDTLYAVANGTIYQMATDRPENHGTLHDTPLPTPISYAGNYIIMKMDNGNYAFYAHCIPNSAMVTVGQTVTKGQPLALLGNSGNSDAPHLHFQVCDRPDFFYSIAVPFVLDKWASIGTYGGTITAPVQHTNSMMEELTIVTIDK
jgi:hypothetical protein